MNDMRKWRKGLIREQGGGRRQTRMCDGPDAETNRSTLRGRLDPLFIFSRRVTH